MNEYSKTQKRCAEKVAICFADEIGERYEKIEYKGDKVLQPWRCSGGNWNFPVTFALSRLLMSFLQ